MNELDEKSKTTGDIKNTFATGDYPKTLKLFKSYMKNYYSKVSFDNMDKNFSTLKVEDYTDLFEIYKDYLHIRYFINGDYTYRNQTIVINNHENTTIFHELLHAASTRSENHYQYCGFKSFNHKTDYAMGTGLNEGYTDLLNERHFGRDGSTAYVLEIYVASIIEEIIGEEEMAKAYFEADFNYLQNKVVNNKISKDLFRDLVLNLDSYNRALYSYREEKEETLKMYLNIVKSDLIKIINTAFASKNKQIAELRNSIILDIEESIKGIDDFLDKESVVKTPPKKEATTSDIKIFYNNLKTQYPEIYAKLSCMDIIKTTTSCMTDLLEDGRKIPRNKFIRELFMSSVVKLNKVITKRGIYEAYADSLTRHYFNVENDDKFLFESYSLSLISALIGRQRMDYYFLSGKLHYAFTDLKEYTNIDEISELYSIISEYHTIKKRENKIAAILKTKNIFENLLSEKYPDKVFLKDMLNIYNEICTKVYKNNKRGKVKCLKRQK